MTLLPRASIHQPSGPRQSFMPSLALNLRIIGALMMREGTARFGHESLGFFWVMGEPLFLTCGVMAMWSITGQTHGHNIGVVPFALSGYAMITLWRHLTGKSIHLIRQNSGLFFHRNIRLLDVVIARLLLESLGILTAFFIAWTPLALLGQVSPMTDPLLLIGGFALHAWFSFGVGLIIAALSEIWAPVEQFVPPILYITLPFTGSFMMCSWLPQEYREIMEWSPLVNTVEMLRAGMFPPDTVTYYFPTYVVMCCVVLTAIGFPLVQYAQKQVSFT
jgi:capsular polysaccharide transport system permease protein